MTRSLPWSLGALIVTACAPGPANVGQTAGATDGAATGTGNEGPGSDTAPTATGTNDAGPTTGGTGAGTLDTGLDTSSSESTGGAIDCPDAEFSTCAASQRELVVEFQAAVDRQRDQFEGGRTVLASELGVPGEESPAALAIALQVAAGGSLVVRTDGQCGDALAGAQAFWTACHGRAPNGGFGCQGDCEIDRASVPTCLGEGRVSCVSMAACEGDCAGACTLPFAGQCDGTCVGTCDGTCDCILQPLSLCAGSCDGTCDGQCISQTPVPCQLCVGPCLYDVAPSSTQCPADAALSCANGGAGTCTTNCLGVPTAPVDTDPCCADLVGLAGELSAECTAPVLGFGASICPSNPPEEIEGVEIALGEVVVVALRLERYETIVDPLVAAMQTLPADLDAASCEAALWNADANALQDALADHAELRAEVDALVQALSGS